jgi:hypothetical protein
MHKTGRPWPVPTRVSYIVAFEELRRGHPRLSARRLHAYLTQAGLISCGLSSVYRVLKRAGAGAVLGVE